MYHPRIVDFGLALWEEVGITLTQEGQIVGTPAYMSPEQAAGKAHRVNRSSDIYSLGVILYELICGELPFRGSKTMILHQLLNEEPQPPRRLNDRIARDLETICLKAMAKEPARRYQSAADLALDLRRFLEGSPIHARPIGKWELAVKWARRHPELAALVSVVVIAVSGLLLGALWYNVRLSKALQATQEERDRADQNLALARKAVDNYLAKVTGDKRLTEADFHPLRRDLLQAAIPFYEQFARQRENDPAQRAEQARAHERLGQVRASLGETEKALANYREMREIFADLARTSPEVRDYRHGLAQSYSKVADALIALNRWPEAETMHRQAITLLQELSREFPLIPDYRRDEAHIRYRFAGVLEDLARREDSVKEYQEALALQDQLVKDFPNDADYRLSLALSRNDLGNLFSDVGRYKEAEEQILQARSLHEQLLRESPRDAERRLTLATNHTALAILLRQLRRFVESEREQRQALSLLDKLAEDFPSVPDYRSRLAQVHVNLGNVLYDQRRMAAATEQCQLGLSLLERLVAEHPRVTDYGSRLANARAQFIAFLASQGDYRKAAAEARRLDERTAISGMARYNIACVWSITLAAALRDSRLTTSERRKLEDEYASCAMDWLDKSRATGYFQGGANLQVLRTDTDLDALRSHPEFAAFLKKTAEASVRK
jgi:tetratricopeptide (TPR) repeat protein